MPRESQGPFPPAPLPFTALRFASRCMGRGEGGRRGAPPPAPKHPGEPGKQLTAVPPDLWVIVRLRTGA